MKRTKTHHVPEAQLLSPRQTLWALGGPNAWLPALRPMNREEKSVVSLSGRASASLEGKGKSKRAR